MPARHYTKREPVSQEVRRLLDDLAAPVVIYKSATATSPARFDVEARLIELALKLHHAHTRPRHARE
jgi:hypothetical protein